MTSYDTTREFTSEELKPEDGVPTSEVAYSGAHDISRMPAGSDLYTVEAQLVPDGKEEGPMVVAEATSVTVKWYQRPLFRWILACGLVVTVVVIVVLVVVRPPSATTSPTPVPASEPPEKSICEFLFIRNLAKCRSMLNFTGGDKEFDSPIPIEHFIEFHDSK